MDETAAGAPLDGDGTTVERRRAEPRLLMFWSEFIDWLLSTTQRFPKNVRFSLSGRIDGFALDVYERLIEARYGRNVRGELDRANLTLEKLRLFVRLAHRRAYVSTNQYEYASRHLEEAGRMIGGWRKSAGA